MTKKAAFFVPTLLIFLPFLLLCGYNQPVVDDMWYTWMAKRYGIMGAQYQWFITINGRYSSNLLKSLNSWVRGSTISFKILPAMVMLAWISVLAAIVRRITGKKLSDFYCLSVSLLLTCCYYLCMPGLHDGAYWMSAVTGYQLPLLLYLCCWLLLFNKTANNKWKQFVLLPLLLIVAGGFHELIAGMACIVCAYTVVVNYFLYKKPFAKWLTTGVVLLLPVLIQVFCKGNRHKANLSASTGHLPFSRILLLATTQTGFHLAKDCLLSPAFWFMLATAWFIAFYHLRSKWVLQQPLRVNLLVVAIPTLFLTFLPGLVNVFIEKEYAPYRIVNLSVFVLIIGCMIGAGLYGIQGLAYRWLHKAANKVKHSCLLLIAIPLCAGLLSGNEWTVVRVLANGSAQQYDKEVQQRFQRIEACKTDTCAISCLTHQPLVLSLGDVCKDKHLMEHLGKVYNKTLVVNSEQ